MVGIVVVAHSRPLARAAVDLAREMLRGREVPIAVAAGLDETTYGTDAVRIQAAIEEVDGPDGVLVLMDLGSAVLSAELALDLLDPEVRSRVVLSSSPLVEGLVVASVSAAGGAALADVAAEAVAALAGKQAHVAPPVAPSSGSPESPAVAGDEAAGDEVAGDEVAGDEVAGDEVAEVAEVFVVDNEHGLHARPAARLVSDVRELDARVTLRNLTTGTGPVPADSLSRVAMLGALRGHTIQVAARGNQAREAVDHVLGLVSRHFDEGPAGAEAPDSRASSLGTASPTEPAPAQKPGAGHEPVTTGEPGRGCAMAAVPGIAIGPAWRLARGEVEVSDRAPGDPGGEWRRVGAAVAEVRHETERLRGRTARELGEPEAAIFDAHLMLLDDTELLDGVRRGIDAGRTAEAAWTDVLGRLAEQVAGLADSYQRGRAADVRAVRDQVVRVLVGAGTGIESRDGVLVAPDLTPAEAGDLDLGVVRGIVLGYGSPTAHSAILVRTRGIPMLVAAGPEVLSVPDGTTLALDGGAGEFVVDPDWETLAVYQARAEDRRRVVAEAHAVAADPARTRDGVLIEVAANLGVSGDAELAASSGADAAGLVRTEFLFLDRATAPDVDEQEAAYRALAEPLGGRRITLRTLDVGGDKPLPYLPSGRPGVQEANPFLGLRGIRLSLADGALLRDQLIAICRVARDFRVSVMFPMVSTVEEVVAARGVLDEAVAVTGAPRPDGLDVGIMVELPAAALKAPAFLPYVDFFSVGTNDLTQYALAAERGNEAVARLADPLDPAVLRLVDLACRAADGRIEVAVCGDAASDEDVIPFLLGLGVRTLSAAPTAVPMVKQAVRAVDVATAARLARQAVDAPTADDVRALLAANR